MPKLVALDKILDARGTLVAAYEAAIATHKRPSKILPSIAGQDSFAAQLKKAREAAGLTQVELAKKAATSYPSLRSWETGNTTPTLESRKSIERLDKILECAGLLVSSWLSSNPVPRALQLMPYRIKLIDWPDHAVVQWEFQ